MKLKKSILIPLIVLIVLFVVLGGLLIAKNMGLFGNNNAVFEAKTNIKIYENEGIIDTTLENTAFNVIKEYECKKKDCYVLGLNKDNKTVIIKDDSIYIINYDNNDEKKLELNDYDDITYSSNSLVLKKDNKYALYNIDANQYISEYTYDGTTIIDDELIAYTNTSKYNQEADIYSNNELKTHYNHCVNIENKDNKLYCGIHVEGKITNEEVDQIIDKVLSQYPDLENKRLFLIKNAIEAVGLPYLWGGGHSSLENTLDIAEKDWNTKMVYLANGFQNQVAGQYYPSGLDCAGFVRWAVYVASGLDIYKDHVNVISGKNTDVTLIPHEDLLPGDIITDKDHITIYLYKDEEGKDISVHASYSHLQVEVSNYKRGNTYWRINPWME